MGWGSSDRPAGTRGPTGHTDQPGAPTSQARRSADPPGTAVRRACRSAGSASPPVRRVRQPAGTPGTPVRRYAGHRSAGPAGYTGTPVRRMPVRQSASPPYAGTSVRRPRRSVRSAGGPGPPMGQVRRSPGGCLSGARSPESAGRGRNRRPPGSARGRGGGPPWSRRAAHSAGAAGHPGGGLGCRGMTNDCPGAGPAATHAPQVADTPDATRVTDAVRAGGRRGGPAPQVPCPRPGSGNATPSSLGPGLRRGGPSAHVPGYPPRGRRPGCLPPPPDRRGGASGSATPLGRAPGTRRPGRPGPPPSASGTPARPGAATTRDRRSGSPRAAGPPGGSCWWR